MKHDPHGYWLEEAGALEPLAALDGHRDADILIVGGGYTGMWAAWHVNQLEPEASVVLLESGICGHGPSGRNGGFCETLWGSLPNMRRRWGPEAALAVARAAEEAVDGIGAFCEQEGVDAWYRRGGYLKVSPVASHDYRVTEAVDACRDLGEADAALAFDAGEVADRVRSPLFR